MFEKAREPLTLKSAKAFAADSASGWNSAKSCVCAERSSLKCASGLEPSPACNKSSRIDRFGSGLSIETDQIGLRVNARSNMRDRRLKSKRPKQILAFQFIPQEGDRLLRLKRRWLDQVRWGFWGVGSGGLCRRAGLRLGPAAAGAARTSAGRAAPRPLRATFCDPTRLETARSLCCSVSCSFRLGQ